MASAVGDSESLITIDYLQKKKIILMNSTIHLSEDNWRKKSSRNAKEN